MKNFLVCKIYDKEYADKLLGGEIFMRPISEFGGWNVGKRDQVINNDF